MVHLQNINISVMLLTTFSLLFLSVCKASKIDQNSALIMVETNVDKEPLIQPKKLNATNMATAGNDTLPTQSSISEMTKNTPPSSCYDEKKFDAFHGGILNYFLRMETCDIIEDTDARMKRICSSKQFAYNEYYKVAYLIACHQKRFHEICGEHKLVIPWRRGYAVNSSLFTENFQAQNDMELVAKSCSSVMEFLRAFEREMTPMNDTTGLATSHYTSLIRDHVLNTGKLYEVEYSEWYIATFPFCRNFACGASKYDHLTTKTSVHDCMPRECRGTIIFSITFDAILAVLIIIANSLVLGVAARTRIMRNIPGYFKISLAMADLTVGLFVLPCCIYVTYVLFLGAMPYRGPGHMQSLADYMPTSVGHFISFFVVFSFAVSIYTMAVASVDRYLAITKPFEYRQGHYLTKRRSAWAFSLIWLIGFFIAAFPAMSRSRMGISAFNIVLSVGFTSAIVYAVTLFIPLLAVWALNGAMLKQVCADREKRSTIRASSVVSSQYSTKITSINNNNSKDLSVMTKPGDAHQSPATSNGSSIGYQRNEKPTTLPSKEGVIEKLKRKRSRMMSSRTSRKQSLPKSINVERRLARTLAIMIGAFTIALLPCIATMIAFAILSGNPSPTTVNQLSSALYLASRIFLSNSFWNCIIYSIRNEHFRRAMWAIFLCKKKRIDRRLRESLSMTQMKHKGQSSSGASMNEKQSLSKSNSNSSNSAIYKNDNRRSTQMWSFTSQQSNSPSRKGSDEPNFKTNAIRTMSCSATNHTNGILKKTIGRSESAPDGAHTYQNNLTVPNNW